MKRQHRIAGILSTMLIACLFVPQMALAQQQNPSQPAQSPETAQQPQSQPTTAQPNAAPSTTAPANNQPATSADQDQQGQSSQQGTPAQNGTTINPSQAPLQPVQPVTTYPDASGTAQGQPSTTAPAAQ